MPQCLQIFLFPKCRKLKYVSTIFTKKERLLDYKFTNIYIFLSNLYINCQKKKEKSNYFLKNNEKKRKLEKKKEISQSKEKVSNWEGKERKKKGKTMKACYGGKKQI